jgi:hypothetical protein
VTRVYGPRLAALAAAFALLVVPSAQADHPSADGAEPAVGLAHMREHAKIFRAQARARARWRRMTPAERRETRRDARRRAQRIHVRARAATAGPASDVGQWALPFTLSQNYRGYAIHAAMLRTGKVLMWGYPLNVEQAAFRGNESYAWLWDPSKGYGVHAVEDVTPLDAGGHNISIYCSGMSFLPDGRVLVVGGTLSWGNDDPDDEYTEFTGLNKAIVFDPIGETWTEIPRPAGSHGRWYPTQTLLPDGRTFVISGLSDLAPGGILNDAHEIYDAQSNSFTLLTSSAQRRDTELYPHLFTMPDGKLLLAGPDTEDSARLDPDAANPWTELPRPAVQRIGGNAVLMPEGPAGSSRVLQIGGQPYGQDPWASTELIDLDAAAPAWASGPALNVRRVYPNTVQLPDGSMVTVGGNSRNLWPPPERQVELYDPVTNSWRTGPAQVETRAYHSTALLLPDGRVLSTGDDLNPTQTGLRADSSPDETGEIYSPPYLFKGPRPVIDRAPDAVRWNVPFAVDTDEDIDAGVLMAPSAVTHGNDMNQRVVPLATMGEQPGEGLTLQSPPSANVAPPGWYMLFLLRDGVPSVARWVRLDAAAPDAQILPTPDTDPDPDPDPDPRPDPLPDPLPDPPAPPTPDPGPVPSPDPAPDPVPDPPETPVSDPELPDFSGPALRLGFAERTWLRRLRRDGMLRVRVTVDEPASVELALFRGGRRVGRVRAKLRAATSRSLVVRPREEALRWLRRTKAPKLRFSAVAVDAARNDTAWTRVLRPTGRRRS